MRSVLASRVVAHVAGDGSFAPWHKVMASGRVKREGTCLRQVIGASVTALAQRVAVWEGVKDEGSFLDAAHWVAGASEVAVAQRVVLEDAGYLEEGRELAQ